MRFAFWLTHRRIVVTGRHLIPKDKPIIFAANHQNALMDPLAVVCSNSYQTVWLARADLFKSKTVRSILNYLKLLPIYRIRDGKDNLSNNGHIFEQVTRLLENKQTVALFPEAAHSGRRQMLPHKKAIPRIALEAEEENNFSLDLQIVPVGIYYSHYWAFNRSMIVQYGEAIEVDQFREVYAENPQKAMLELRDELFDRIAPLSMQIKSNTLYADYEKMRELAGTAYSKILHFSKNNLLQLFHAENDLIKKLEHLEFSQPDAFEELKNKTGNYFRELADLKLSDEIIAKAGETGWIGYLIRISGFVISLPVFIAGFLFNALPFFIPRMILRRKVKDPAFLSTFNFVAGLISFPLFYILEALLLLGLTGSWILSVFVFFLMPFTGKFAYQFMIFYQRLFQQMTIPAGGKTYRNNIRRMAIRRKELVDLILGQLKVF